MKLGYEDSMSGAVNSQALIEVCCLVHGTSPTGFEPELFLAIFGRLSANSCPPFAYSCFRNTMDADRERQQPPSTVPMHRTADSHRGCVLARQ